MNANQKKGAVMMLKEAIAAIESGEVEWFVLAYKNGRGTTLKVRSEAAPKTIKLPRAVGGYQPYEGSDPGPPPGAE